MSCPPCGSPTRGPRWRSTSRGCGPHPACPPPGWCQVWSTTWPPASSTWWPRPARSAPNPPPRTPDEPAVLPDEADVVGEDDGLHAVAQVQLGQHAADVRLDRRVRHHQLVGDL